MRFGFNDFSIIFDSFAFVQMSETSFGTNLHCRHCRIITVCLCVGERRAQQSHQLDDRLNQAVLRISRKTSTSLSFALLLLHCNFDFLLLFKVCIFVLSTAFLFVDSCTIFLLINLKIFAVPAAEPAVLRGKLENSCSGKLSCCCCFSRS